MSNQVPTTFVTAFENNMKLSLQQHKSLLWGNGFAIRRQGSGEKTELDDLIGAVPAQTLETRHGDIVLANTPHDRVWAVKPSPKYYADMVDRDDQLAAKIAIESGYTMTATATIARARDDAFLSAVYGSIISGKSGTTTLAFPSANIVAVDVGATAATRMNVAKLRAARKTLAKNYNDMQEKRFIILTAEQVDDLMNEMPIASKDFNDNAGRVNAEGRMIGFMGFTFIEMELANPLLANNALTVDSNSYRKNPFWVQSGIAEVPWNELYTSIDPIPQKANARQVYAETTVTATATENGKRGYILNSEA
jgi:hypothetical protein